MFPDSYFAPRYFPGRYWQPITQVGGAGWCDGSVSVTPGVAGRTSTTPGVAGTGSVVESVSGRAGLDG